MWILSFIPDSFLLYVIHAVLVTGIVGTLLSFFFLNRILRWFPQLAPFHLLAQIVSIVLLASGLYFSGGYHTEMEWRDRVAKLEAQIKEMEVKSEEINKKLDAERKKKQKVRTEYYNTVKTEIKEVEKLIDGKCELDPKVNELHNKAAKNPEGKK
jgi:uncharacterized membrane protein YraQ (UPF0718 family)